VTLFVVAGFAGLAGFADLSLERTKSPAASGNFAVSCCIFSSLALKSSMFSQICYFVSPPMSVPG
jgi:hypothetical protein